MSESGASSPSIAGKSFSNESASRRTWFSYLVLTAALVTVVGVIMVRAKRPELTPEEREHLGTWYGYIHEGDRHYCWLTRLHRDRTCEISFRNFYSFSDDAATEGARRFAFSEVSDSRGTWRINGADYVTETWYPRDDPGTVARTLVWLREQRWLPRNLLTYSYKVEEATADHFVYTMNTENVTFHAVRVPEDFVLPREPVTNEAALAGGANAKRDEAPTPN